MTYTLAIYLAAVTAGSAPSAAARNNLALHKPVSMSSQGAKKYLKERAVDGEHIQGSRWASRLSPDGKPDHEEWLAVDLERERTIARVRILWQRNFWAKDYDVQVSRDGQAWRTMHAAIDAAENGWIHDIEFAPVSARHVRVLCRRSANIVSPSYKGGPPRHGSYSIIELEVYAWGKTPDPLQYLSDATGKPVTASLHEDTQFQRRWHVNDGRMTTFWATGRKRPGPHWIYVDMEKVVPIGKLALYWHNAPTAYSISVSDDARSWKPIADHAALDRSAVDDEEVKELHTKSLAKPMRARYVRVDCTGPPTNPEYGYMFQELLVFVD